jgi:dipeptidyl aminopeptidase/acylaminoacyl peptidase
VILRNRLLRGAVAAVLTVGADRGAAQSAPIDRIAWLAGCWEQRGPDRLTMETWMPPFGGAMIGASRTVIGGALREFEHIRITTDSGRLVYTALPSGQRETKFPFKEASDTMVVFENLAHDFPQRIIYRKRGVDSVIARIEGPGANNTVRGTNFPFRRASCTERPAPPPPPDTAVTDAKLSPDGRQMLVVKAVGQNFDIYSANPDGTNFRKLTDHANVDYQPAWSPDGRLIAFASVRNGHQEVYTMRADGSEVTALTNGTNHSSEPAWSPDGKQIVFRSERGGRPYIFTMNADGTNQRQLGADSAVGTGPSWSRDGKRIAFGSNRTRQNEVWTMNPDGTDPVRLTTTPTMHSGGPQYSPDGTMILFWSTRDGASEVYLMQADGSNVRNLTRHPAADVPTGWTPDGRYILFRSLRDRTPGDIYRMRVDGSEVTRVTTTQAPPK